MHCFGFRVLKLFQYSCLWRIKDGGSLLDYDIYSSLVTRTVQWQFMKNRKIEHPGTVAPCNKYVRGDCQFSPKACWWSHTEQQNIKFDSIECFICCKAYKSRNDMMIHREKHQPNVVRQCEKYKQDYCSYKPDSCWYLHGTEVKKIFFLRKVILLKMIIKKRMMT